jgi:hypothetical protein
MRTRHVERVRAVTTRLRTCKARLIVRMRIHVRRRIGGAEMWQEKTTGNARRDFDVQQENISETACSLILQHAVTSSSNVACLLPLGLLLTVLWARTNVVTTIWVMDRWSAHFGHMVPKPGVARLDHAAVHARRAGQGWNMSHDGPQWESR